MFALLLALVYSILSLQLARIKVFSQLACLTCRKTMVDCWLNTVLVEYNGFDDTTTRPAHQ